MIDGVKLKPLKVFCDDRGYLYETLTLKDKDAIKFAQSAVTMTYPGVIKAFHYHKKQDDVWAVVSGMAQVVLWDGRADSPTKGQTQLIFAGDDNRVLITIPRGVVHGYRVLGTEPVVLVYYTSALYDPKDEYRIDFDDPRIGFDWITKNR